MVVKMDLNSLTISNNTLLIIPDNIKSKIIKKLSNDNILLNIKIMSIQEFSNKFYFSYDEKSIYYLMNKYNYKYSIAKEYLDNLYYIDDNDYDNEKINFLKDLKSELIKNKLLNFDSIFIDYIKNYNIVVYGYDYINKFYKKMFDIVKKYTKIDIIEKEKNNNKNLTIYEFKNIESEISFIAQKIIDLIKNGVDINRIFISNVGSEYYEVIKRIFKFYNLPVCLDETNSIYSTSLISDFTRELKKSYDIENSIEFIIQNYDLNIDENSLIFNKLINVCNKYNFEEIGNTIISCIEEELKNVNINKVNTTNSIKCINLKDNIYEDNEHIFIIGFNQGTIPKLYKDEDYLGDNVKLLLNLETTTEKNIIEKQIITNIINKIPNLTITYKLESSFDSYYPSSLIDELNMKVVKIKYEKYNYSNLYNKIQLSQKLDTMIKFNTVEDDLDVLYSNYKDLSYLEYDNKFTGINKNNLKKYLDNKLLLSYSSIDNYFKCSFRYYINNILKLDKYEETFPQLIGNLFHYILSKAFEADFNYEEEFTSYVKNKNLNSKETFLITKLKGELLFVIETIKQNDKYSKLNESLYEQKIYIDKSRDIKITFMGIIDKIKYRVENGKTYIAIIDYKTGNTPINLNNTIYGLNMQLPIYLYLAKNYKQFNDVEFIGFYLQKILNNEISVNGDEDYELLKRQSLKLNGYSINDESLLEFFDSTYKDSEVIKSMRMSSKGFYSYAKVLSKRQIDKLTEIVDKNIDTAINGITDASFQINPKRIGQTNIGCEFCNYKDLCYMNEKNIVNLEEHTNLDFLGCDV